MKMTEGCEKFDFNDNGRIVEKVSYKNNKIYINKSSYFYDVDESIWQFLMGGYQPLVRWFKDRKGKELTEGEIEYYMRIISVIAETISIMNEIELLEEI